MTDLAIVGFGPTGAMAALRCAQRGLSVVAIDASTELYPHPRAIGLDAEGARLFHTAGLADELAACSTPTRGAEFVDRNRERVVGFDLPADFIGPLGHPPMVMFEQPQLESALRAAAIAAGVDVRLGVAATGISIDAHGVRLDTSDGEVTSRWLIGADGASSWTRRALTIDLEDQGYDQPWLVVDTTLIDPELPLPPIVQQVCDPERITTYVVGHDTRRRWEFHLRDDEDRDEMLRPERIAELLEPWGRPDQLRVDRAAVYRFHALVAERFRSGPVFLAGDAAHQMPPFNGQGMNSGLRDAENLAWKLALVSSGIAIDALLDTYEAERRPHSVGTVEHTCDAGRLIGAIAEGVDVSPESGYGGGRPAPVIEHGLVDGSHRMVGRPVPQPRVGTQLLDEIAGDGFAIIAAGPVEIPEPWTRVGARFIQVDRDAFPPSAFGGNGDHAIVVRPDRIVASVTDDLNAAADALLGGVIADAERDGSRDGE